MAARVPLGMSLEGCRRSPLILMPAMIPVTVGKNTPNTVNQLLSSWKSGNVLLARFSDIHPEKPFAEILNDQIQECSASWTACICHYSSVMHTQ